MDKDKNKNNGQLVEVALEGGAQEIVQRYGSAIKEHSVAYFGKDNETGQYLTKALKSIAESRVNKEYARQNILQQSGFAAEVKYTARENAKKIINSESRRVTRTDDVGRINDPLYDHITVDKEGWIVSGSGEQMKFVGKNAKACLSKLRSTEYEKYLEADATITVPSDYYDGIRVEANSVINRLEKQLNRVKTIGNQELISKKEKEIIKVKKIISNLKNSGVSTKEALEARLNPIFSTAKDMGKLAHKAGIENVKIGTVISGCVSIVSNIVTVLKGNKNIENGVLDIIKDTGQGALRSYATAVAGSLIKGTMQNAGNNIVRGLSKTNLPTIVVTTSYEMGKTLKDFITGKINGVQCFEQLGEQGTSQISAALFAMVGQMVIPVPVLGAIIGSMVGYALSSSCYKVFTEVLKEAKLAKEYRLYIEKECQDSIVLINLFHKEMNDHIRDYLFDHKQTFNDALNQLSIANGLNDVDLFIVSVNKITDKLGGEISFNSFDEFDTLMKTEEYTFKH